MKIAVIGAGAAGCFAAINLRRMAEDVEVVIYERGARALAKVAVSGGGRCNLTNSFRDVTNPAAVYPRGERLMKRLLKEFGQGAVCRWFQDEGVPLMTQEDQRVFPQSGDAMEIVNKLLELLSRHSITLKTSHHVKSIIKEKSGFRLSFESDRLSSTYADKVVVATGGCRQEEMLDILKPFCLEIVKPVPSLFSFCITDSVLTGLSGVSVEDVILSVGGFKLRSTGHLLITHGGISGPAVLKLSSYAARYLAECGYKFSVSVNWMGSTNEQRIREELEAFISRHRLKLLQSAYPERLNARLWKMLLLKAGLRPDMKWCDLGKKGLNRLTALLVNDSYEVKGKNKFKDEFVTCGGVALGNINPASLECRTCEGLYFAGEVLDVDAVTGGFNLQAAWTMGYIAARSMANAIQKTAIETV